jgi:hypothetical protein
MLEICPPVKRVALDEEGPPKSTLSMEIKRGGGLIHAYMQASEPMDTGLLVW